MELTLSDAQKNRLAEIFRRGAMNASDALSRWLGRPVGVTAGAVVQADLAEASAILGPGDSLVAACPMELTGALNGQLILVFEDRAGLALVDLLLHQPIGTTPSWGELEQSAAKETANIVGCAYLNALALHLPTPDAALLPGPPGFRHEFAASLLEFALMDQATVTDHLLAINSTFSSEDVQLDWSLLFIPGAESLEMLRTSLATSEISDLKSEI